MAAATVRAQAKLNLYLRITGREASGYHTLDTLFCRIDLADTVTLHLTPQSRSLDCFGPEYPQKGLGALAENLAWRAAAAYVAAARWPSGFHIDVEKQIPVGAGLGGGSADAAAVLRLFNALNPRPLAAGDLHSMARALGADVPFLTDDTAVLALAAGRGDVYRRVAPLPPASCTLAIPPIPVATQAAYAWVDEARGWSTAAVPAQEYPVPSLANWDDVRQAAHNDFEAVVCGRLDAVERARRVLDTVASGDAHAFALMTGSGGASFAISPTRLAAIPAAPGDVRVIATHTSSRVESIQRLD
jgi:4-diphosphocytidyl-2-C-methyl-D-erythritol kinase